MIDQIDAAFLDAVALRIQTGRGGASDIEMIGTLRALAGRIRVEPDILTPLTRIAEAAERMSPVPVVTP